MIEDPLDDLWLCDEADDAHGAGAPGADEGIDLVDTAQEVGPTLARVPDGGGERVSLAVARFEALLPRQLDRAEFRYQEPFPLDGDDTKYRNLTRDLVSLASFDGQPMPGHLKALADQGFVRARSLGTTNLYRMGRGELERC